MPQFDDTPEGRYESNAYYGHWNDGDFISAIVSRDEEIAALKARIEADAKLLQDCREELIWAAEGRGDSEKIDALLAALAERDQ